MNFCFFKQMIISKMEHFKLKYSLTESFENQTIKYYHDKFTLMFSMDNYLEVSVCFVFNIINNKIIYLQSLVEYLNFPTEVIRNINKNQHNEKTLESYLQLLLSIIDDVIDRLITDNNIFSNYFLFESNRDKVLSQQIFLQEVKKSLSESWDACDYVGFLELYKKNRSILSNDSLLQKKASYCIKKMKTGDGSVS